MTDDRIDGAVKTGVGRVQDAAGGLVGDDKMQAKGKVNEVAGSVQDTVGKVKDQAQDAIDQTRAKAGDVMADAKDRMQDSYDQVSAYTQDQPLRALAAALGVGVVLGLLMRGPKVVYVRK